MPIIQWHFLTSEHLFLKSAAYFFKVHLLCSLSCSWWCKFSLWKRCFPNVKVCVLRLTSFLITSSGEIFDSLLPFFHQHFFHQHITVVCPFSPCQHYNLARKLVVFCVIFFNLGLYYTCSRLLFVHKVFCRCTLDAQIPRTKVCKKLAEIPPKNKATQFSPQQNCWTSVLLKFTAKAKNTSHRDHIYFWSQSKALSNVYENKGCFPDTVYVSEAIQIWESRTLWAPKLHAISCILDTCHRCSLTPY